MKATNGDNKEEAIDVQDDDIMEVDDIICASSNNQGENILFMGVFVQVVPHANGAGDNKRKGGEDGSEPSAKKSR